MNSENSAADWFARMRGCEADEDRAAFASWYADPRNAAAYDHLARTWDQAKFLANTPAGRMRNLDLARPGGRRRKAAAVAAAMLLVLLGGLIWAGARPFAGRAPGGPPATSEIAANGAAPRVVVLADGSRVTLDRGSRLGIAFTANERRLSLRAGRARFDVAHDATRPFSVEAGNGQVVAHGTVFDVAMVPNGIEVALLQGVVEVRDRAAAAVPGRSLRLVPGQAVVLSHGTLGAPRAIAPRDAHWPQPMIEFHQTPLGEAVAAFNRAGGRPIRVEGASLRDLRVTGAFRRDDPEGFATALAATFGLAVRYEDPAALSLVARSPAKTAK